MIIGYHDWRGGTRAHDPPLMVDHLEMDIESNFFTMMPAIARDAHGKDHGPGGEVKLLWTVELEQTERRVRPFSRFLCIWLSP